MGWGKLHPYIFMLKQIITTTLLATAISNTTITNTINKTVYMDDPSYWTYQTYTDNQNLPTGIDAYQDIQTTTPVNNSSFTIKQRTLITYTNLRDMNFQNCQYYFVMYMETGLNIDLTRVNTTIFGTIQNLYNIQDGSITYYNTDEYNLTDTVVEAFLNGTNYTTVSQYNNVRTHLNSILQSGTTTTLDNQNLYDLTSNRTIYYQSQEGAPYFLIYSVLLQYDADELPIDQIYTPYGDYGNQIYYNEIQYQTEVAPGGTGEIVDIPGIMFTVLGMPFSFVAQAFNLTIFPGTAYAVNLSHIFLAIIGAGILIFVVKKFLK